MARKKTEMTKAEVAAHKKDLAAGMKKLPFGLWIKEHASACGRPAPTVKAIQAAATPKMPLASAKKKFGGMPYFDGIVKRYTEAALAA